MTKRPRRTLLWLALGALVGLPVLATAAVVTAGFCARPSKADVALVLGSNVAADGTLSARLRARLDKTVELYKEGYFPNVIASGAIDPDGDDATSAMRDYLVVHGLPGERVFVDVGGEDTFTSARHAVQIARQRKFGSVLVISQYFHIPRVCLALRRFGMSTVYSAHAHFFELRDLFAAPREVAACLSYAVRHYEPMLLPTLADVPYGAHPRQVLDFYQATSDKPAPLVLHIHGGGWEQGDKQPVDVSRFLAAGISVATMDYRFVPEAEAAGVRPPVEWPMHDAARALQFLRSKAGEWNIDKTRVGATGESAGACSGLWLAFHEDMADPQSSDPIARESTRLRCAAVSGAQTSLDPQQMHEWTPNSVYGGHAFGFKANPAKHTTEFAEFLAGREKVLPWIKEYSPYEHVSSDDPPVYLIFKQPPALGQAQKNPTHTANFGVKLQELCQAKGVECELVYPGAPKVKHASTDAFLIEKLKQ